MVVFLLFHIVPVQVYLLLIKTYMSPTPLNDLGIGLPGSRPEPQPSVDAAMEVLANHHKHIDTAKVCVCVCV